MDVLDRTPFRYTCIAQRTKSFSSSGRVRSNPHLQRCMALPRSFVMSHYRRLIKKTTTKTMMRSPREPGHRNQPPPLEYPATRHPDSPRVAPDAATIAANRVSTVDLGRTLFDFAPSNSSLRSVTSHTRCGDSRGCSASSLRVRLACCG
jgi:hypothetical protein